MIHHPSPQTEPDRVLRLQRHPGDHGDRPRPQRAAIAILGSMIFLIVVLLAVLVQTTWGTPASATDASDGRDRGLRRALSPVRPPGLLLALAVAVTGAPRPDGIGGYAAMSVQDTVRPYREPAERDRRPALRRCRWARRSTGYLSPRGLPPRGRCSGHRYGAGLPLRRRADGPDLSPRRTGAHPRGPALARPGGLAGLRRHDQGRIGSTCFAWKAACS